MIGRERGIIEGESERKMIDCYSVARVSNVPVYMYAYINVHMYAHVVNTCVHTKCRHKK